VTVPRFEARLADADALERAAGNGVDEDDVGAPPPGHEGDAAPGHRADHHTPFVSDECMRAGSATATAGGTSSGTETTRPLPAAAASTRRRRR
jgi:hypothetical protein